MSETNQQFNTPKPPISGFSNFDEDDQRFNDELDQRLLEQERNKHQALLTEQNKLRSGYNRTAKSHGENIRPGSPPTKVSKFSRWANIYRVAQYGALICSLALLTILVNSNLDYPLWVKIAVILGVFSLVTMLLPILPASFEATPENPESIKPVRWGAYGSVAFSLLAILLFSIFRSSPDIDGFSSFAFQASLPLAELGLATAAAFLGECAAFYSFSNDAEKKDGELTIKINNSRAEIARLERNLRGKNPSATNSVISSDDNLN